MNEHAAHHGPSYRHYVAIFVSLAILTAATVLISYSGLAMNVRTTLAFIIAAIKAVLVGLIFMHLRFERRTIVIFAVSPILLAFVFILAIAPDVAR
jgi:caa(3)-type oxidase subunit IV